MKISCVIICKNNEKIIERTLKSVLWCDEIIIVDSGSTDNTLEICNKYNCKIYQKEFTGFGELKRYAVSLAENDWILSIDSDELISEELAKEIKNEINNNYENYVGFTFSRALFFLNKKMRFAGTFDKKILRVFNKKYGNFNNKLVHESIEINGKTKHLKNIMYHYSYDSIFDYFKKFNDYTELAAKELYHKKKQKNRLLIILRFPFEFIKRFIFQLGFLDGYYGFVWSFFSAFYPVVKYMKVYELFKENKFKKIDSQVL